MVAHSAENDVPPSPWLEAVIRAAVIEWNSNPEVVGADVSRYLTEAIWPVLQVDRAQVWEECAKESHGLGWLHDWALSDLLERNPYRVLPPGGTNG